MISLQIEYIILLFSMIDLFYVFQVYYDNGAQVSLYTVVLVIVVSSNTHLGFPVDCIGLPVCLDLNQRTQ
jgi:hypothetical protein